MNEIRTRIDSLITAGIAPLLKGKDFIQRKRYFYRDNVNCISVVNIQASKWNRGSKGEFTINLGVYYPDVADIMDSIQFTGLPKIEDCTVRKRIGFLMSKRKDHWWKINRVTNIDKLAVEVTSVLSKDGIPWLDRMVNLNEVQIELSKSNESFKLAGIALLQEDKQQALEHLLLALEQRPHAKSYMTEWGVKYELLSDYFKQESSFGEVKK